MGQVESSVAGAVDQGEPLFPASQPDSHAAASTTSSMESLIAGRYLYFPLSLYIILLKSFFVIPDTLPPSNYGLHAFL